MIVVLLSRPGFCFKLVDQLMARVCWCSVVECLLHHARSLFDVSSPQELK